MMNDGILGNPLLGKKSRGRLSNRHIRSNSDVLGASEASAPAMKAWDEQQRATATDVLHGLSEMYEICFVKCGGFPAIHVNGMKSNCSLTDSMVFL